MVSPRNERHLSSETQMKYKGWDQPFGFWLLKEKPEWLSPPRPPPTPTRIVTILISGRPRHVQLSDPQVYLLNYTLVF